MSKRDSILDMLALLVVVCLFIVGWMAFAFTQAVPMRVQAAVMVLGILAFSISLNRLGRVEPLIGGDSRA